MRRAVGIDFGTTNSAIAVCDAEPLQERVALAEFEAADGPTSTYRSILFFDREDGDRGPLRVASGPFAIERYLASEEPGRLVQSLKSFLASPLFSNTNILGKTYRLEGLIAHLLSDLRGAAEKQFGTLPSPVVVGRPVQFAGAASDTDEALALSRLEAAFHNAGFPEVVFEYEPVAAAYFYERDLERDELILIGDFGGGTSDFSLIRVGPSYRGAREGRREGILGTAGVGIAGDAFDGRIVRHEVAPALGAGGEYRSVFDRVLKVPAWIYAHLERWHHLSFLRTPRTLQLLFDLEREALEREKLSALLHVVREDLGFRLYRAVEQTKLRLSAEEHAAFVFVDGPVALDRNLARGAFESWIEPELATIDSCVARLIEEVGVTPGEVDRVFLTGGSSFVPAVRALFASRFGLDRVRSGAELTSVASGLALRALEL